MTITMALIEAFDDIRKAQPARAALMLKTRVTELLKNAAGEVIGVAYQKADGVRHGTFLVPLDIAVWFCFGLFLFASLNSRVLFFRVEAFGPVIIATGGYGADFTDGSLLAKHR
jgi:hypothetical protein